MAHLYYPGCQYTACSPENSAKIKSYLRQRFELASTGCCRTNHQSLKPMDTAICVCPTCLTNLRSHAPHATVSSIWELLAADTQFPWHDYGGLRMTVQDCKDTCDNKELQHAVRSLLHHMRIHIVEVEPSLEYANFCRPQTEEQIAAIKSHCAGYKTDTIVCYCTGCLKGLQIGGVHGIHLLDLLFGRESLC